MSETNEDAHFMDIGAVVKQQYKVVEHIGRGGMADVWSARDERLQRMVAIKTIVSGLSADVDPVALFEREAQTIAQMEHPHILPIYDFGEYDNSLYIVMRYVTGGSLEDVLNEAAMPLEDVLRVAEAVAKALDYAHENNIIHLDLKPPNILLDSSESPYLADFGLATMLDPQGRAQNPGSGTLLYMAPEQFVEEVIDWRADIYSFGIMLYHMLTGRLPFEGGQPLALRQIQQGDVMPPVGQWNADLPDAIDEVLRHVTAQEPENRPDTHMQIVEDLRAIIEPAAPQVASSVPRDATMRDAEYFSLQTDQLGEVSDPDLLEAVDIYSRARHHWQGGQGRFLLGVTHFMLMSDYYQQAQTYNLNIDEAGYQLLLRGALEYDYELDYWWSQVTDANRRWVCLHALRSGNAPARIRAMYRLETLPDDDDGLTIPRLVAQALEVETDPNATIAALQVLSTRARLREPDTPMQIQADYRGRLLSSLTRGGILAADETAVWRETVYTQEIDELIAETAFHENDAIAEAAARTVGQMRSLAGVQYVAAAQREKRDGALRALAYIRDEAPSLPPEVTRQGRFYAWMANTVRRLTDNPLDGILRFVVALLGAWLGMGEYIYNIYPAPNLLSAARWGSALAIGIVTALIVSLTVLFGDELSRRLHGFWSWGLRLAVFGVLGFVLGMSTFAGYTWFYLEYVPVWDIMRFAGGALATGVVLAALLDLRGWQAVVLVSGLTFAFVHAVHVNFHLTQTLSTVWLIAPLGAIIGVMSGWRAKQLALLDGEASVDRGTDDGGASWGQLGIGAAAGGLFGLGLWSLYGVSFQTITWDGVLGLFLLSLVISAALTYSLTVRSGAAYLLLAVVTTGTLYALIGSYFYDYSYAVPAYDLLMTGQYPIEVVYFEGAPFAPAADVAIFYYQTGQESQVYTVVLPMLVTWAIGAYGTLLLRDWQQWIGAPRTTKEREGWLSAALVFVMVITAAVSVLALFSVKTSVVWGLGWSAWAFVTFVCALAAWRWAKWGADALLVSGMLLLVGGFVFDLGSSWLIATVDGQMPPLWQPMALTIGGSSVMLPSYMTFWAGWALLVGIFANGAQRNHLWGGIGLVTLLVLWFGVAIFSSVPGSVAVLAMTTVGVVAYALSLEYEHMEADRFMLPQWSWQMVPASAAHELDADDVAEMRTAISAGEFETVQTMLGAAGAATQAHQAAGTRVSADTETMPDTATQLDAARASQAGTAVLSQAASRGNDGDAETDDSASVPNTKPMVDESPSIENLPTEVPDNNQDDASAVPEINEKGFMPDVDTVLDVPRDTQPDDDDAPDTDD